MTRPDSAKRDITQRFSTRADAERYRDRFEQGKRRRTHERELDALRQVLQHCGPVNSVLDVGSGTGRFAALFSEHARQVVQLDLAINMLDVSREAANGAAAASRYIQGDIRRLPISTRSMDLVFCHRLLNHLPGQAERHQALANLARAARRFVVVSSLGPPRLIQRLRNAYDRLRGAIGSGTSRYVTPESLMTELQAIGLRLTDRVAIRSFPVSAEFLVFSQV